MKATLTFNLPEEQSELDSALNANCLASFIVDFQEYLLKKYKHSEPETDTARKEYESIRQHFIDQLIERNIDRLLY